MIGISVIVCCYNSAARLPQTLTCLAAQKFSFDIAWEVIIVDNASTDQTRDVAESKWRILKPKMNFRIIEERKPGLSYARQRGIEVAQFDIVIFCDDDNWLADNYLDQAFSLIQKDSSIGAVGACGIPVFETKEPAWFKHWKSFYAIGDQGGSIAQDVNGFKYVYGAGMVVNKTAMKELKNLDFKNITTDRIGNKLVSGGDIELCFALQIIGYKVLYSPQLKFGHFITAQRLSLKYALRLASGIGYSSDLLFPYRKLYHVDLKFPFPSPESYYDLKKHFLHSLIVLMIPLKRYGNFFEKLKVTAYLRGKVIFHRDNQGYFTDKFKFLFLK